MKSNRSPTWRYSVTTFFDEADAHLSQEVGHIVYIAGNQFVDVDHLAALSDQPAVLVGARKTGPTRDERSGFLLHSRAPSGPSSANVLEFQPGKLLAVQVVSAIQDQGSNHLGHHSRPVQSGNSAHSVQTMMAPT